MPDRRRHRGQHPADAELFGADALAALSSAVSDMSWLLSRGYSDVAALKLVGDRYQLRKRQRDAVMRCSCASEQLERRASRRLAVDALSGRELAIDGFNCIITVEAMLAGGVVLIGRDGCYRDISSVHGNYRAVAETTAAISALVELLAEAGVASVHWFLDQPVSNSGRLAARIREIAAARLPACEVEVVLAPDRALVQQGGEMVVATTDSWVLDHCDQWVDLSGAIGARRCSHLIDLSSKQ